MTGLILTIGAIIAKAFLTGIGLGAGFAIIQKNIPGYFNNFANQYAQGIPIWKCLTPNSFYTISNMIRERKLNLLEDQMMPA